MLLDVADERLRVRLSCLLDGRRRLVIDYPAESAYRDRVLTALSDLLRPHREQQPSPGSPTCSGETAPEAGR